MHYERRAKGPVQRIPAFALYGEAIDDVELRFLHIENLAARNQLHNWEIRPHRHHDLYQILFVSEGEAEVTMDEERQSIVAPALISVPALTVHGFRFHPRSQGSVLTIADGFRRNLIGQADGAAMSSAMELPLIFGLHDDDSPGLAAALAAVTAEFLDQRVCRSMMITAQLLIIFIAIVRLHKRAGSDRSADRAGAERFAHFQAALESHFRERHSVEDYARQLATTRRTLHRLCLRFANQTPQQLLHRRVVLEAKRNLIFTSMKISEVGYSLGFTDPSYFTNFFTERVGISPLSFRLRHQP